MIRDKSPPETGGCLLFPSPHKGLGHVPGTQCEQASRPELGEWMGLEDEAGDLEASLPRSFLHSFPAQANQEIPPLLILGCPLRGPEAAECSKACSCCNSFLSSWEPRYAHTYYNTVTTCDDQVRHRNWEAGGETSPQLYIGEGFLVAVAAHGWRTSVPGGQMAGGLCS